MIMLVYFTQEAVKSGEVYWLLSNRLTYYFDACEKGLTLLPTTTRADLKLFSLASLDFRSSLRMASDDGSIRTFDIQK
jgi:hypothetical protein